MRPSHLASIFGALLLAASVAPRAAEPIPGPATDLYPATREYQWTLYVPVVTIERREIVLQAPVVTVRSRRYHYEVPGLRDERRKLGQVPEFHCKYPDWQLPNECGVEWHEIYGDFPQLTMRREHVDVDVPEWSQGEHSFRIDVPHVTWTPRTLTLVVPVLQTEPPPPRRWARDDSVRPTEASVERARGSLAAGEAASSAAVEEALAALGRSIAAVEAQGGDPSKLTAGDGTALDLRALRQSLLDGRAVQSERYARIRAELDAAGESAAAGARP
jgi:hypothetical protein